MKKKSLWSVSVATLPDAEEAISELLQDLTSQAPVSYTDIEMNRTLVACYLHKEPDRQSLRRRIAAGLLHIRACGLQPGPGKISIQRVQPKDWMESWKRHFKAIEIGSTLLVKPSWSRRRALPGQATVVLDPGLSFGTGQHPTTRFCLEQLVALRGKAKAFLDIGTGSGILAITAAKLGYTSIQAFDFDPAAVRIARVNARQNGVARRIRFFRADLKQMPLRPQRRYDLICANLISTLLFSERKRIVNRMHCNGALVLAGILAEEFEEVRKAYETFNLRLRHSSSEGEWRSGLFSFA